MTPARPTAALRERLRVEARDRCGYCHTQQTLAYASLEVDHIVPVAAGGGNEVDNLWLACRPCNQYKGTQVYGEDPHTGRRMRLFDPRRQIWRRHFAWSEDGTHIIIVLALTVKPALNRLKPYRTAGGRFYVRVGRDKKDATGRELMRIAQAAGELHYDESPVLGAGLDELSQPAFEAYHRTQFGLTLEEQLAQSGLDLPHLLRNLRLLHDLDGEQALSIAALLVFGRTPQRWLPQSRLSAVAFAGRDEDADILDRREIMGRLPTIIDDIRIVTVQASTWKHPERSPAVV